MPESRFYVQPVRKITSAQWYTNNPTGKNSLSTIAKRMAEESVLQGRLTNHSGRHTAIQTLLDSSTPAHQVMQLSGHKRVESLNSYNRTSVAQQREISRTLSSITTTPKAASATITTTEDIIDDQELVTFLKTFSNDASPDFQEMAINIPAQAEQVGNSVSPDQ